MSKRYFYCWYLGFTEVNGLIGQQYVIDGIQKLTAQSRLLNFNNVNNNENNKKSSLRVASKVTLGLNENSFILIGGTTNNTNNNATDNQAIVKSYTIEYEKISYITRLNDNKYSDIVALIIVNTDDGTLDEFYHKNLQHPYRHIAYLHAFKFDSVDSAKRLEKHLNEYYFNYRQRFQKIPFFNYKNKNSKPNNNNNNNSKNVFNKNKNVNMNNLVTSNQTNGTTSNKSLNSGGTTTASSSNESEYGQVESDRMKKKYRHLSPEVARQHPLSPRVLSQTQPQFQSENQVAKPIPPYKPIDDITQEFKKKLFSEEPLLLPPKDYNTVMRSRGDLEKAEFRRSLNQHIVGKGAIEQRVTKPLEKIDENQQTNVINNNPTSPRSVVSTSKINSTINDDDDLSIDEEAKRVLNYYDAIVNSISMQPLSGSHYRFEPPDSSNSNNGQLTKLSNSDIKSTPSQSSISPSFDLSNTENLKMNPLHIIDEEYTPPVNKFNKFEQYKQKNSFLFKQSPLAVPSAAQSTPSLAFSAGFRSNALTKLGNYAPKAMPKPPIISASMDELQNSRNSQQAHQQHYYKQSNPQNQFGSSLQTENFYKMQQQQQQFFNSKLQSNRNNIKTTYEEPDIDYNTDTVDVRRNSNNSAYKNISQFILKSNQIPATGSNQQPQQQQMLFTKVNKNLNHSTPNMIYESYYNQQQIINNGSYADVYY